MERNFKKVFDWLKAENIYDLVFKKILTDPDDKDNLDKAVDCLRRGGVIVFYSEATYGLATHALERSSIERLRQLKKRDATKPLGILSNKYQVEKWASFHEEARDFHINMIRKYWPGHISFILKKRKDNWVPDFVVPGETVCLMCMDRVSEYLSLNAEFPIASTSANASGDPSLTDPVDCIMQFGREADLFLLGPPSKVGINTTIIDLVSSPPRVLREGPIRVNLEEFTV